MTFTLNNLADLMDIINASSKSNDMLPSFMNRFDFIDRYTTEDDSYVFMCGDKNELVLEFFDVGDVYKRTLSITYREPVNGHLTVLEWDDLKRMF